MCKLAGLDEIILFDDSTLDDPEVYIGPNMAIHCEGKASFHVIPKGLPAYDKMPG